MLKILFLTNIEVDKNAIKKRYALNVKGGASLRALSVITNVAPHAKVVNIKPSLANVTLLIFYSLIDCCDSKG